jgi:tetratricopeptide (TPR) repeat protein
MSESKPNAGKKFFDHGDQVALTGNWDFAIEMYAMGVRWEPTNMERGWHKLREVAMKRKAQGGKAPNGKDKKTHKMGKDPLENLSNAAFLWAKDPGAIALMRQVLDMAWKSEQSEVLRWIGDLMVQAQSNEKKPSKLMCVHMVDAFETFEHYDLAVNACRLAIKASPNDEALDSREGHLSARYTLQKGKYGEEGHFSKGVLDMEKQNELMQKDSAFKSDEYLQKEIKRTRTEYEESPMVPGKINAYAHALTAVEDNEHDTQAVTLLEKAFVETQAYQFKLLAGDVQIKQMHRKIRLLREADKKAESIAAAKELLKFEVVEYAERAKNYPTDMEIRYELGRRLFLSAQYDDAIAALQHAARNPRRLIPCMNYLGQAFMKKQWWQEAVDTFEKVLKHDMGERTATDIRYNLANALELLGTQDKNKDLLQRAEQQFSDVAQIDFNYKDVRDRLEGVRKIIRGMD